MFEPPAMLQMDTDGDEELDFDEFEGLVVTLVENIPGR